MSIEHDITSRLAGMTDFPCISLVIPTDDPRLANGEVVKEVDQLLIKMRLSGECREKIHANLLTAVSAIPSQARAAGIYISCSCTDCVPFSFRVDFKINVDSVFETSELLRMEHSQDGE